MNRFCVILIELYCSSIELYCFAIEVFIYLIELSIISIELLVSLIEVCCSSIELCIPLIDLLISIVDVCVISSALFFAVAVMLNSAVRMLLYKIANYCATCGIGIISVIAGITSNINIYNV